VVDKDWAAAASVAVVPEPEAVAVAVVVVVQQVQEPWLVVDRHSYR
jgi:hypothetical protein